MQGLLDLADVDHILTRTTPRPPTYRVVRDGQPIPRSAYTRSGIVGGRRLSDLPDTGRILRLFDEGATIALQGVHRWWPPVADLVQSIEAFLTHPLQANAYVTPAGSRGLDVHHDTHDVLAWQTVGSKHWVVHDPVVEAPLPRHGWSSATDRPGRLVMDTHLSAGDCLYLPRGTPHAAETVDDVSVHLTIGIRSVTWQDVLEATVREAGEQVELRQPLPAGFARDPEGLAGPVAAMLAEAGAWVGRRDPQAVADAAARRFWRGRRTSLSGGLEDVVASTAITQDTEVRPRPETPVLVQGDDDRLDLVLGDRTVTLPAAAGPAVSRLLDGPATPAQLDDLLDEEGRIVLVRRLVREGLLTLAADR